MDSIDIINKIKLVKISDYCTIFELYNIYLEEGFKNTDELEEIVKQAATKQFRGDDYLDFYKGYISELKENEPNWKNKYFQMSKNHENKSTKQLKELSIEQNNYSKYPALKIIMWVQKIFSYLILIIGISASFYIASFFFDTTDSDSIISAAVCLLATFVIFTFQLAFAEIIKLFLDIEFNTRK